MEGAQVICCTCAYAGDERLNTINFANVLIDEATHTAEPICMIPIIKGVEKVILVGDQCQPGPIIKSEQAVTLGLGRSLFERLIEIGIQPNILRYQYKMHPILCEFSSKIFYGGSIENGVTCEERSSKYKIPWPILDMPLAFIHSSGLEEKKGQSYRNLKEAHEVFGIVRFFFQYVDVPGEEIGIICTYAEQKNYLIQRMKKGYPNWVSYYNKIQVDTVDEFQGRKEFIILSCTRSNNNCNMEFIKDSDWRKINFALTRATHGLIICGNADFLSNVYI